MYAMWLEMAAKPNMEVARSTDQPSINGSTELVLEQNQLHRCEIFPCHPRLHTRTYTHKYRGRKKRAHAVTAAVAREEGRGARWSGGQATAPEVRGSQATRRSASCHTRQRTCPNLLRCTHLFCVGFPFSCLALARRKLITLPARARQFRSSGAPKIVISWCSDWPKIVTGWFRLNAQNCVPD